MAKRTLCVASLVVFLAIPATPQCVTLVVNGLIFGTDDVVTVRAQKSINPVDTLTIAYSLEYSAASGWTQILEGQKEVSFGSRDAVRLFSIDPEAGPMRLAKGVYRLKVRVVSQTIPACGIDETPLFFVGGILRQSNPLDPTTNHTFPYLVPGSGLFPEGLDRFYGDFPGRSAWVEVFQFDGDGKLVLYKPMSEIFLPGGPPPTSTLSNTEVKLPSGFLPAFPVYVHATETVTHDHYSVTYRKWNPLAPGMSVFGSFNLP